MAARRATASLLASTPRHVPHRPLNILRAASSSTTTTTTTASSPSTGFPRGVGRLGLASYDDGNPPPVAVPKPPDSTWYTASPSFVAFDRSLDDLIHRTRHALFHAGVLTRYAATPDFRGTGIRLRHLRWKARGIGSPDGEADQALRRLFSEITWKDSSQVQLIIGDGKKLKISTYRRITARLNELRALSRYVNFAISLGSGPYGGDTLEMRNLESEIADQVALFVRREITTGRSRLTEAQRDAWGRYYGLGRKKSASARAWLIETVPPAPSASSSTEEGKEATEVVQATGAEDARVGQVRVNGRPLAEYFVSPQQRAVVLHPFMISRYALPSPSLSPLC